MSTPVPDVRVRRPQQYEALLQQMRDEAGFSTFRDGLLFAAALGARLKRKAVLGSAAGDPIRYETLTTPVFAEALVSMLAANEFADDPEIMDDLRLEERIRIFEDYATGGLEYLQEQLNVRHQPIAAIVLDAVTEALSEGGGAAAVSVDDLLGGVTW